MTQDLHLFIAGKEVEFREPIRITYNYKDTELRNPTIIRNSFSQTIEVPFTSANNDLFGNIWSLERTNYGMQFNPSRKTNFELYLNAELVEKGYVKLTKVEAANNTGTYSIQLFGNVGNFLYNLSYNQGDLSDEKRTLNSLSFKPTWGTEEPDLNFTMDKDSVKAAWDAVNHQSQSIPDDKWDVITFIPTIYEGIPDDFDANKVLINQGSMPPDSPIHKAIRDGGVDYKPILDGRPNLSGWSLGETSEQLTCDESLDLRSYLQRPAISVRRVIEACCNPENNGGFEVKLDSHFFNVNNPYYYDSWMTLPMIREIAEDLTGTRVMEISGATLDPDGNTTYIDYAETAKINNVSVNTSFIFTPSTATSVPELYTLRDDRYTGGATLQGSKYVRQYRSADGYIVQLIGRGRDGSVVAQSKAYLLATWEWNEFNGAPLWQDFWQDTMGGTEPEYEFLQGKFVLTGGSYVFADLSGNPQSINFSFTGSKDIHSLEFRTQMVDSQGVTYKFTGSNRYNKPGVNYIECYPAINHTGTGLHQLSEVKYLDRVEGSVGIRLDSFDAVAETYAGMFSGTRITRDRLLTTDYTPADFLLSYIKQFGLYLYQNPRELAEDQLTCPNGVIHICDRDTFYTDEVIDIQDKIDRSKKISINPATAVSKWYAFDGEAVDSAIQEDYGHTYGGNYGRALVNTNYNFDNATTQLLDKSIFKTGAMTREKDKYFSAPYNGAPIYIYNGFKYDLYALSGDETKTYTFEMNPLKQPCREINTYGLEWYDVVPKLQAHNGDNEPVDAAGVLLFYQKYLDISGRYEFNYWLTDDNDDMAALNDGTPCWIMTNSEFDGDDRRIAYKIQYLPVFTRDIIYTGGQGNIVHSWNYGHPKTVYVPNWYSTDYDCIYDKCWRSFMRDLYDDDNKVVTAYVQLGDRPSVEVMRKFYWFDNGIYRINAINSWNVASLEPIQCEFIKVEDMNNYTLEQIDQPGQEWFEFDDNIIAATGETITGRVYMQSAGHWRVADYITGVDTDGNNYSLETEQVMTPYAGAGEVTEFEIVFPANIRDKDITWTIAAEDDFDHWFFGTLKQTHNRFYPRVHIDNRDPANIPATATSIAWRVTTNCAVTLRCSNGETVQFGTDYVSSAYTGTFTIPANTGDTAVEYYLSAVCTNFQLVTEERTITQEAPTFEPELIFTTPATIAANYIKLDYFASANTDYQVTWNGHTHTRQAGGESYYFVTVQNTGTTPITHTLVASLVSYPEISITRQIVQEGAPRTVTGISLTELTWVTDVPATGGTADINNCSAVVMGYYNDGTSGDITSACTFSGSLVVSATTASTREQVGLLGINAFYDEYSSYRNVYAYQAAAGWQPTDVGTFRFFINDPAYGAASPGYSAEFEDRSGANSVQIWVDDSITMGCGFEGEVDAVAPSPVDVVGEHSFQFNASYSGTSQVVITFDAEGTITGGVILTAVLQKGTDQKTVVLPKWGSHRVQAIVDLSDWFTTSGYIDVTVDFGLEIASAPTNYEFYIQKAGASVITSTTFYVTYTIKQGGVVIKSDTALLANTTTSTTISLPQLSSGDAVLTALEVVPRPRVTGSSSRSITASTAAGNTQTLGRTTFSEGGETMYKWVKTSADLPITSGCALRLTMS